MRHGFSTLLAKGVPQYFPLMGPRATTLLFWVIMLAGCGTDHSPTPAPASPPPATVTAILTVPSTAQAGTPIVVDASGSTSSTSSPLTFGLDFGDGTHGGVAKLAKMYASVGTYTVTLTVLDAAGHSASATQQIAVTAGTAPGPTVQVQGVVHDMADAPLAGVTATLINGNAGSTTDAQGHLGLSSPTVQSALIKLSMPGYADQFVPLSFPSTAGQDAYFLAHMLTREPAQTLSDAAQGGTLTGKDGAKFTVGGAALVDGAGKSVTGAVQVAMTPVDISKNSVLAFPGQFAGITANAARTSLVSYGTVEFSLTQNGNRLQLAPGKSAVIEIPAYANANIDGTALTAGAVVPLWSLDETTGQWVQEGSGTVTASANSPTGWTLQATVGHFSWWNMDGPIDSDYQPKPKCQDSGLGIPGSVDHLANATICNMLAQFGAGGGAGARRGRASASTSLILPSFGGTYTVPIGGGVSIGLPANKSMLLSATALNGTWIGQATVMGAATDSPEIIIPMSPVQSAPPTEAITLPFDQSRTLAPGQSTRLSFTASGDKPVNLDLASGPGSNFTGEARLLQGSTVIASIPIGSVTAVLNSSILPAGDYIIEIVSTSSQSGTFALQAAYVHWISQGPPLRNLYVTTQTPFQLGLAFDAQNRPVIMDSETYNPNNDQSKTNGRYVFNRLVNGQWVAAADAVDIGSQLAGPRNSCVAFALDHAGNPAYVGLNADEKSYAAFRWSGTAWQAVGANNGTLPQTRLAQYCVNPPVLIFDGTDHPFVAFDANASTGQSSTEIVVMKFDGVQWVGVGPNNGVISPPNTQNGLGNYAMALDSTGKPVVEWNVNTGTAGTSQPAYVLRYQDSPTPAWVGVGSASGLLPSPSGTDSYDFLQAPSLALDANDQPILAAGLYMNTGSKIFTLAAYQFDGSQWLVSDEHTAAAAGQVAPAAQFTQSSNINVTHNAANQVVVAWPEIPDATTGYLRYYVQTWTGTAWQGLGSADGLVDNPASPRLDLSLRLTEDTSGNLSIAYFQNLNGTTSSYLGVSSYVP